MLQSGDVLTEPLKTQNGALRLSDKPGLGVEIDEEKLNAMSKTNVRESVFFDFLIPYVFL
jgi:L-alanine-DL-glutamate epimerase-like enolase superfamily enzyme